MPLVLSSLKVQRSPEDQLNIRFGAKGSENESTTDKKQGGLRMKKGWRIALGITGGLAALGAAALSLMVPVLGAAAAIVIGIVGATLLILALVAKTKPKESGENKAGESPEVNIKGTTDEAKQAFKNIQTEQQQKTGANKHKTTAEQIVALGTLKEELDKNHEFYNTEYRNFDKVTSVLFRENIERKTEAIKGDSAAGEPSVQFSKASIQNTSDSVIKPLRELFIDDETAKSKFTVLVEKTKAEATFKGNEEIEALLNHIDSVNIAEEITALEKELLEIERLSALPNVLMGSLSRGAKKESLKPEELSGRDSPAKLYELVDSSEIKFKKLTKLFLNLAQKNKWLISNTQRLTNEGINALRAEEKAS